MELKATYLVSAGAILAAFFLFACDKSEYPSPIMESNVEASAPAFRSPSEKLAATGGKFLGQVVEVTGTIEHITNKGGAPSLILNGGVICGFGKKQKRIVGNLNKGDQITLRGIYYQSPQTGTGPYLTPCIFIR